MTEAIVIKNGTLVTMDQRESIVRGDLLIREGRIESLGGVIRDAGARVIDAGGCAVLPGFVQTHVHLCQTLVRGAADDLPLIDWLKQRIWPLEAAHNPDSVRASARLGIAEMIKGGTTCALTMETVHHTEEVFRAVDESGFRATIGKCMMDAGDDVPAGLAEDTRSSVEESLRLLDRWHNSAGGRIHYCFAPRFALSCTRELLERVAALAIARRVMVHTHASEHPVETDLVERATGQRNINYFNSLGLLGRHVGIAHCVQVDDGEIDLLAETQSQVLHCPSSNLKLGSGIAPVTKMLQRGINVSLGADGAACNNRLDMLTEMRSAALLQKAYNGAEALLARRALHMATLGGARALGLEDRIGSLEVGKRADVITINLTGLHMTPRPPDIVSGIVYSCQRCDVDTVIIDGRVQLDHGKLVEIDEAQVVEEANRESVLLRKRAGLD